MIKALLIKGGRIIDPAHNIDWTGNLLVKEDKIAWLGKEHEQPPVQNFDVLSAKGMVVCPGFIELHCHLREPGFVMKETIATGTRAAARGGYTTVCCMPNTRPPLDSAGWIEWVKTKANTEGMVRVFTVGCVTKGRNGKALIYMEPLVKAGVVGFSDDGDPVRTPELMREALGISKVFNLPIIDHCEDPIGGPPEGEEKIVARDVELAEETKGWVHIAHISTAGAVELVRKAREKGARVTAEVTAHHLTLTKEALKKYGALAKLNPPLRTEADCAALVQGLKDGVIDVIATDHAPHMMAEKQKDFEIAPAGISGFETALGSLMGLVHAGKLELGEVVACLTSKPAKILNKPLGTLEVGTGADITIFDPDKEWLVDVSKFASMGKNTPLEGKTLKGKVMATIFQGNFVYKDESIKIGLRA